MGERLLLAIERLGAQGDGVAAAGDKVLHVPFALPGERVAVELEQGTRARLVEVLTASPERVAPACRHFGRCGGCKLQHLAPPAYLAWKRETAIAAFAARGLKPPVAPVRTFSGGRRRAVFAARRTGQNAISGFHTWRGQSVVPLEECPVLAPPLERALPFLSRIAALFPRTENEMQLTLLAAANGVDAAITGVSLPRDPTFAADLAALGLEAGFVRLTVAGEAVLQREIPYVAFGRARVPVPPGAFLQASAEAEAAIAELVAGATIKARRVADLFSGLGAFTFPLAERAQVLAVDSDRGALAALAEGARRTPGLKPIETVCRDLFRTPLSPLELRGFDAAVLDPPRAGARAESEALARSEVPLVVFVSCDPATLARDARVLVDSGFRLECVTLLDQFRFSPHTEAVAVFRR